VNEEVQQDTENIGAGAAMDLPQQACGNDEWNAPPKQDASLQKVQNSGDQAADCDSQKSVRLLERVPNGQAFPSDRAVESSII